MKTKLINLTLTGITALMLAGCMQSAGGVKSNLQNADVDIQFSQRMPYCTASVTITSKVHLRASRLKIYLLDQNGVNFAQADHFISDMLENQKMTFQVFPTFVGSKTQINDCSKIATVKTMI